MKDISDFDDYFDFEKDLFMDDEKDLFAQEFNRRTNDNVDKDKSFEQYVLEKSDSDIISFLGPHVDFLAEDEIETIR